MKKTLLILTSAFALQTVSFAVTTTKPPDVGPSWHWLRPNGGTYVYADSFVAPISGDVTSLGTWLGAQFEDPTTTLLFQVWGSVGNNAASGPDAANGVPDAVGSASLLGIALFAICGLRFVTRNQNLLVGDC